MSKMESKKLHTFLNHTEDISVAPGENFAGRLFTASAHDARIAHEQREVIRRLAKCLRDHQLGRELRGVEPCEDCDESLAAAAPFLED